MFTDWLLMLIMLAVCVTISFCCSVCEGALSNSTSLTFFSFQQKFKRSHKKPPRKHKVKQITKALVNYSSTLSSLIIANNIIAVAGASGFTVLAIILNFSMISVFLWSLTFTILIIFIGEIVPKIIARWQPDNMLYRLSWFLHLVWVIFLPITILINTITPKKYVTKHNPKKEDISNLAKISHHKKNIDEHEHFLLQAVLKFSDISVKQVMIKDAITSISTENTITEIQDVFFECHFSRLPIANKYGKYIGYLYIKDFMFCLHHKTNFNIMKIKTDIVTIDENEMIDSCLDKMQAYNIHMFFVTQVKTDHKAKQQLVVCGIITMEDIMERVFGKINDEKDEQRMVSKIDDYHYVVLGKTPLSFLFTKIFPKYRMPTTNVTTFTEFAKELNHGKALQRTESVFYEQLKITILKNRHNNETFWIIINDSNLLAENISSV